MANVQKKAFPGIKWQLSTDAFPGNVDPGFRVGFSDTGAVKVYTGLAAPNDWIADPFLSVSGGGGGGGGAATIASGADVTEGTTADAASTAGGTGTISGKLRRISQGIEDLKTQIVLGAGNLILGQVGIDQTTPGTTNKVSVDTANGAGATTGAAVDAIVAAGAVGTVSAKLRRMTQGLEDLKTLLVLAAGSNIIGKVGIDQTTPGTTDSMSIATAQGAGATIGATADAVVAAGATGSLSAKLRRVTQGLEDLKTLIVLGAGSALIGKVGFDQTTPGTTNNTNVDTATGAGATLGVTTGAAVITDANGTIQQYLRGLVKLLVNIISVNVNNWPAALVPTVYDSTAKEASKVVKASPGTLYSLTVYNAGPDQWYALKDATSAPSGASVGMLPIYLAAQRTGGWNFGDIGKAFATGITVYNSTADPSATATAGASDSLFSARYV